MRKSDAKRISPGSGRAWLSRTIVAGTAGLGVLFCFAAAGFGGAAHPHDEELRAILTQWQKHYDETSTFQANFVETISRVGANERVRRGRVYFSKPGRMRWEFAAPDAQSIVSDGTTLYTYDPDLNQVIETPLRSALRNPGAAAVLLGLGEIEEHFDASLAPVTGPRHLIGIALKPRGAGETVEVGLDPSSYDIATLRVRDSLGNVTSLVFTDIENNVDLSESLFRFEAPEGADIVQTP